jgi:hypothetical protein
MKKICSAMVLVATMVQFIQIASRNLSTRMV